MPAEMAGMTDEVETAEPLGAGSYDGRKIAAEAGLPRGVLAVPARREDGLWVHDGAVGGGFVVDPRWGLRWRAHEERPPAAATA